LRRYIVGTIQWITAICHFFSILFSTTTSVACRKDGTVRLESLNNASIELIESDIDGDGLQNWFETEIYNTDPNNADTDGGGEEDGEEVANGRDPLNSADDVPPQP